MFRALPVWLIAGVLAGCSATPGTQDGPDERQAVLQADCYQTGWQAETIQVIYKRGGQEVWDRYDPAPQAGNVGCR